MPQAQARPAKADKNRHIREYLSYFTQLPQPPQFAVMLNGPWGVGKTFLVKNFIREIERQEKKVVYVSLFGLSAIDEIDGAVLQAIYPALGWQVTKLSTRVAKTLLKVYGVDADLRLNEVVNKFQADLYVFDDLERYQGPINQAIGYINGFVEHDGCKVVVVANESEIPDTSGYRKRREKLIGRTLEVQSAFEEAFDYFVSLIDYPDAKTLFQKNAAEIATIYHQSEVNNLRILQQTMWDFERVVRVLTDPQRHHGEATKVLLRLLFALSFELKAGRIEASQLRSRINPLVAAVLARRDSGMVSQLTEAGRRYPEVDLSDTIIPDDLLIYILTRGVVDEGAVRSAVELSRYFRKTDAEPAWRTVWHWFDRTDDEFNLAHVQMEAQFAARDFTLTGEVLHVLGLRLFLADLGILKKARDEVVREGKLYIDDLYAARRIEIREANVPSIDRVFESYGGLGIQESETPEYREMSEYLDQKQKKALEDTYPQKGLALLKEMNSDPQLFFRRICLTDTGDSSYYKIPIFASIDLDAFATSLLKMHPANQRVIFSAIKTRYEHGGLDRELAVERPWLTRLRDKLVEEAGNLPPIGKHRLLRSIESGITSVVPERRED